MERINLIPAERIMTQRLRTRRLRWWSVCVAYASVAVTLVPALSEVGASARELDAQQQRLQAEIEAAARANTVLAAEHARLARQSRLAQELLGRADWGRLLGAVAEIIRSDVALTQLTLTPLDKQRGYALAIAGVASAQQAVNDTAMRLKQLSVTDEPLFDSVTIEEAKRRSSGPPLTDFRIRCVLLEARSDPR